MATDLIDPPVENPGAAASLPGPGRPARRTPVVVSLLSIVLSAFLAGVFLYQMRYDVSFQDFTYPWTARWITYPYNSNTVCFRKTFTVDGPVRSAYLVLAADNFYQLHVNGVTPIKQTLDGVPLPPVLLSRQTTYSETGYGRRSMLGNVYDIRTLLLPGRNTISVIVQSDDPQQKLLLQGVYLDSTRHVIESDASWRCSPIERIHNGVSWYLPEYPDASWPRARPLDEPANIPVDNDASLFETPVQGYFISAPHGAQNATTRFRRMISCPGTVAQGWIRVNWWCPYELSINGVVEGGSSDINRYNLGPFFHKQEWDVLRRVEDSGSIVYPSGAAMNSSDVYLARNIMHRGVNEIDLTLHNENTLGETPIPAIDLNAHFLHDTGASRLIVTDGRWQVFDASTGRWVPAVEAYAPSSLISNQDRPILRNWITPGSWGVGRIARNAAVLIVVFALMGLLVERVSKRETPMPARGRLSDMTVGSTFIAPAIILTAAFCAQTIFAESRQTPFVLLPSYAMAALLTAGAAWLVGAALSLPPEKRGAIETIGTDRPSIALVPEDLRRSGILFADRYGFAIALGVIVLATALYSFASLDSSDLLPDEYVSMLAARGILRHGIPIYENTHIIYTRSALYHYILALFMLIGGSTTDAAVTRAPAGCWHVATVILVYFFGRDVKSRWTGLFAAAMVGLSPLMIFYAREARFYTQFTFFSTLCFYYLWRSLRDPENGRHRVMMGLAFIGGYLSQQLIITALPTIVAVVFLAGRMKDYFRGSGLAILLTVFAVIGLDYFAYVKYCETPLPFVDTDSMMLFAFHVDWLDTLPSMLLVSNEHSELAVGGLYVFGLAYLLGRSFSKSHAADPTQNAPWRWWNFLYIVSVLTIGVTTLFTPRPTPRYVLNSVPLVALAAAAVAEVVVRRLDAWATGLTQSRRSRLWTGGIFRVAIALLCIVAFRPVRVWNNTQRSDDMNTTASTLYVKTHMRPGDKLFFCSPELAMMEIGHCDYFWRVNSSSIYSYKDPNGVLRERNSGAVAVNSIDKLRDVVTQNSRVWLVVPNWETHSKPYDSEYLRMSAYVRTNFRLVDQDLDDNVYLWDRSGNHYENPCRESGEDGLNFSLK